MRPILIVIPRSDETFAELADRLLGDGVESAGALERELRATYPNAQVHERSLSSEAAVTWYVYREGRWIPGG
jgi:hypothetical protein